MKNLQTPQNAVSVIPTEIAVIPTEIAVIPAEIAAIPAEIAVIPAEAGILHIITSHAWGGLELYVVTLVKKLLDEGIKTAIYCIENTKVDCEAKKLGIPIYYGYKQARISIKDILNVRKIMKMRQFEIIHTHTRQDVWQGSLVKLFLKKTQHIFSLYMSAPSKKGIFHKFIYRQVDAITSSSEILNERIKKNYPIPAFKVHLLRYGRDQNNYGINRDESLFIRKLLNTTPGEFVFATMCRLDSAKGVREIAESLLHLSEEVKNKVKIWIMGEPTLLHIDKLGKPVYEEQSLILYKWLKSFVDQQKNKIELIPFQKNIRPYLEAMDVFILGTYKETYSLSVLDAMGFGLPVIGTNSGGTPEQVKHQERGFLVDPKSAKSIAGAIEYYVENKILITQHGAAAKLWVRQEHDWKKAIFQLKELYNSYPCHPLV